MSRLSIIKKIYKIYFTSFPYYNYNESNRVSNLALYGISYALVLSQHFFWIANIGCIYIIYNIRNNNFYYNISVLFCCILLYIVSFIKVISLIKYV
jgi:hypothetical protein